MAPTVRFVKLKTRMMAQKAELVERYSVLLQQMRDAVALRDVLALVPQIDQLEEDMGRASAPIACMRSNSAIACASSAGGPADSPSASRKVFAPKEISALAPTISACKACVNSLSCNAFITPSTP